MNEPRVIIQLSAPCCGQVEITPAQVTVVLCSEQRFSYIAFTCPLCEGIQYLHAADDAIDRLTIPGVDFELWEWEMPKLISDTAKPPTISVIDIERFQRDVMGVDRLGAAASTYFQQEAP